jgi:hypothetical protein
VRSFLTGFENGTDLYFGVASRSADATDGSLTNCRFLAALFVDVDFKVIAPEAAEAALKAFIPPSAVVASGGGTHCYWFLNEPLKLSEEGVRAKTLLRKLAIKLGGDITAAEPVRILRIPGTFNNKYSPPRAVEVINLDESLKYTVAQMERALADVTDPDIAPSNPERPDSKLQHRRIDMVQCANGFLDGERDIGLFRLACALRARGFSYAVATDVVIDAAARCRPPFSPQLAQAKVASAWRYS